MEQSHAINATAIFFKAECVAIYLKVFFLSSVMILSGCLESSFDLASDSRLPKWFYLPENVTRNDVDVTLDYHISLFTGKGNAVFKLRDKSGRTLKTIVALTAPTPLELKKPPEGFPKGYPAYEIMTVNGITDIVEHRQMEPIFYMTDDPAVWKELGVELQ